MVRLIFLLLVVLLAFLLWRGLTRKLGGEQARKPLSTDLVLCSTCGKHVPKQSALPTADGWQCREHEPDRER
ncbi:MAG: hypothetical protein WED00_05345 [Aquisalimonadaceae bacterium]